MEDVTPPRVLPGSWQPGNLELSIKSFFLGSSLKRQPTVRNEEQPPAVGTFGICCCVQVEAKSSLDSLQPSGVTRVWPSLPNVGLPFQAVCLWSSRCSWPGLSQSCNLSFFLPILFVCLTPYFSPWVSDQQCSLKVFPAYSWPLSPISFSHCSH